MKRTSYMLMVLLFMMTSFTAGASTLRGDVNNDDKVNIDDVTELIDYLLTGDPAALSLANADCDLDGKVNISDITELVDYLLTDQWPEEPVTPPDGHEWVDLGLPSGTIWATCNVGASSPEEYGDYFAWGETAPKSYYDRNTYKWFQEYHDANGNLHYGYTKYCTNSSIGLDGFVDNKTELDPSDDAACAHYPDGRMPSLEQIHELCNSCSWQWTQRNGVNGQLVTGPNGNTMFLPAAGYRSGGSLFYAGSNGYCWSRALYSYDPGYAVVLNFTKGFWALWYDCSRLYGFTVRAVRVS